MKNIRHFAARVKSGAFQVLRVRFVNDLVFRIRLFYFLRIRNHFRTAENLDTVINPDYSKKMLLNGKTSHRPMKLIGPILGIDHIGPASKILSVGPRYETEILYLLGYGFRSRDIHAVDIFSYSPWIQTGNMHSLPYSDDEFDVAILGWIIPYSERPSDAAQETLRVMKPGGVVAVGVAAYSQKFLDSMEESEDFIGEKGDQRLQTTAQIMDLFKGHVDQVYFRHDVPDASKSGSAIVIFSVKK
jgi:SAM-dependent methyltransferase